MGDSWPVAALAFFGGAAVLAYFAWGLARIPIRATSHIAGPSAFLTRWFDWITTVSGFVFGLRPVRVRKPKPENDNPLWQAWRWVAQRFAWLQATGVWFLFAMLLIA